MSDSATADLTALIASLPFPAEPAHLPNACRSVATSDLILAEGQNAEIPKSHSCAGTALAFVRCPKTDVLCHQGRDTLQSEMQSLNNALGRADEKWEMGTFLQRLCRLRRHASKANRILARRPMNISTETVYEKEDN